MESLNPGKKKFSRFLLHDNHVSGDSFLQLGISSGEMFQGGSSFFESRESENHATGSRAS